MDPSLWSALESTMFLILESEQRTTPIKYTEYYFEITYIISNLTVPELKNRRTGLKVPVSDSPWHARCF